MVREGLVFRLIFLLFFIITIISAASLKHSIERANNGSNGANSECVTVPGDCFDGGTCGSCPYDPRRCYLLTLGNCTSTAGLPYGLLLVIDISCGIGTQSIGLAKGGYQVTTSDLPVNEIERAKQEAQQHGQTNISFSVCDMRTSFSHHVCPFDVVISCDKAKVENGK